MYVKHESILRINKINNKTVSFTHSCRPNQIYSISDIFLWSYLNSICGRYVIEGK